MSQLEAFRDSVLHRLEERANKALNNLGGVRFRAPQAAQPMGSTNGQAVALPSFGMEEIALAHTLHQAEAQVLTEMRLAVEEEFRKAMGQPAEANDPEKNVRVGKQEVERKRGIYG